MTDLVASWRDLSGRHASVSDALERELHAAHGLSLSEFEVLQRLDEGPDIGIRIQLLADDVHMSQSALSRLVTRLEHEGLATRHACPLDRRGIYAVLTEPGRARVRAARPTQAHVLGEHLA
jgi:DNA-binding MarR family transcriptional regulator